MEILLVLLTWTGDSLEPYFPLLVISHPCIRKQVGHGLAGRIASELMGQQFCYIFLRFCLAILLSPAVETQAEVEDQHELEP